MTLANARFVIDGQTVTEFVLGRRAELAVDVSNFPGGDITFTLYKGTGILDLYKLLFKRSKPVAAAGAAPRTETFPVVLNHPWENLNLSSDLDIVRSSWREGDDIPYPIAALEFEQEVTDDLVSPPFHFEVSAANETRARSGEVRRNYPKFHEGNAVQLFIDGDQALPAILQTITNAEHHIHMNWFFFAPDEIGLKVMAALIARAQAGVRIRLLMDIFKTGAVPPSLAGMGVGRRPLKTAIDLMRAAGIEIAASETALLPEDLQNPETRDRLKVVYAWSGDAFTNIVASGGLDFTDHEKYLIVDGVTCMCGGMNCAKEYIFEHNVDYSKSAEEEIEFRDNEALGEAWGKWHDHFAKVQGPAVADLQKGFFERWAMVTGEILPKDDTNYFPPPTSFGPSKVKVLLNVPGLEQDITSEYLKLFSSASQKILMENPYFTDDLIGLYLAQAAKLRNVPTTLIVPDEHLDFSIVHKLMMARYGEWKANNIRVYEFNGHMTHVKLAAVDNRYVILGSYNCSKGSAIHHYECNIVVDDPAFAADVEQRLFNVDKTRSNEITGPVEISLGLDVFTIEALEPYL